MKLLLFFVLLFLCLRKPIGVGATPVASVSSPVVSPVSPISTSMAAFSPGIQVGIEESHTYTHKKMLIIVVVACTTLAATILSLLCLWIYHRKFSHKSDGKSALNSATDYFRDGNVLGEGGFGCVYKAQLDDNLNVAVKKLNCETQDAEKEFENEVDLLSKTQHPNIISLLGCCIHCKTRFIVYELMQNGSLEIQLHGPSRGSALTWHKRMKIALDAARGLEYLHEHCNPSVIHRDLKSSNILLDSNFNAKLSDFGLAVTDAAQNKNNIKLSGTLGYVAPEYLLDGKLTDKSDVYAFGVVLLELLLGRRPVEKLAPSQCQSMVTWAMPQLTDRSKLPNIVDPAIKDTMDLKHLCQVAAVAVLCVQPEPSYRPLITDVLHSLVPLVPVELGGTLRVAQATPPSGST
ncbi:probable receptor-like protein kinase At1g80640 isoform X2 [Carya illinoinensis]|uniref:Protein kinase domain-containing protein n=1 Tax=Carya illinoinensis TaxID=32201 RepID=A0A8T1PNM3_CARIL|nr:probable receptor-like protein kinase At1g80640 isoform X2 [Carya illinoinensis]KAG6643748.1 hypothetical protein CIPAW_08G007900 [Carya illinoinensis]